MPPQTERRELPPYKWALTHSFWQSCQRRTTDLQTLLPEAHISLTALVVYANDDGAQLFTAEAAQPPPLDPPIYDCAADICAAWDRLVALKAELKRKLRGTQVNLSLTVAYGDQGGVFADDDVAPPAAAG